MTLVQKSPWGDVAAVQVRAIAYEKSGRWFTAEEPFLRAKERTDVGSSAFRHPRSELIAPLPQEVEPAFNNRKLHMRLPWVMPVLRLSGTSFGTTPSRWLNMRTWL